MITDILGSIATVAQAIYAEVARAKANQAQCKLLEERITIIVKAVKDLEKIKNADHYRPGLVALETCLKDALKFITEYSKDKSWFKKVLKAGSAEEQFKKITEQLQKCIEQLNLGLIAQQVINHEQDVKAQAADVQFIHKQQEVILKLNLEANRALQNLKFEQDKQNVVFLNQLASMRQQLVGKRKDNMDIEAHLVVWSQNVFVC
jgi:hypothetical protein